MEQTLINHPRLSVRLVTGTEGPRHDPYHYTELRISTPQGETVVHQGLSVFAMLGDQRIDASGKDYDSPNAWCDLILEDRAGYTMRQLERIHRKSRTRCPAGGHHDTMLVYGFAGESFEHCEKCGKFIDSYFSIKGVM
jgi:hypothetical protein